MVMGAATFVIRCMGLGSASQGFAASCFRMARGGTGFMKEYRRALVAYRPAGDAMSGRTHPTSVGRTEKLGERAFTSAATSEVPGEERGMCASSKQEFEIHHQRGGL